MKKALKKVGIIAQIGYYTGALSYKELSNELRQSGRYLLKFQLNWRIWHPFCIIITSAAIIYFSIKGLIDNTIKAFKELSEPYNDEYFYDK